MPRADRREFYQYIVLQYQPGECLSASVLGVRVGVSVGVDVSVGARGTPAVRCCVLLVTVGDRCGLLMTVCDRVWPPGDRV